MMGLWFSLQSFCSFHGHTFNTSPNEHLYKDGLLPLHHKKLKSKQVLISYILVKIVLFDLI